jgi:predicted acylesterase/phospholipase RssA
MHPDGNSRPWRPVAYLILSLAALLVLSVLLQGGIIFLGVTASVVVVIAGIAMFVRSLAVTGALITIAGVVLTYFVFFHFIGARIVVLDIACAVFATALAIVVGKRRKETDTPRFHVTRLSPRIVLLNGLFFWLLISAADAIRPAASWHDSNAPLDPAVNPLHPITVTFSGGGYRAALFHAGVMQVLGHQALLPQAVASVSGGSIFSSFYVRGGSPTEFRNLVVEHAFNLKRRLFDAQTIIPVLSSYHIASTRFRVLPFAGYSRTMAQAGMLDAIFLNASTMDSLRGQRIELMICTTDLEGQRMLGFTPYGYIEQPIRPAQARTHFANPISDNWQSALPPHFASYADTQLPSSMRLSEIVAASGAFPGAFTPVRLGATAAIPQGVLLVDGGVGDNLGLTLASGAAELGGIKRLAEANQLPEVNDQYRQELAGQPLSHWQSKLIIVSDGSEIAPASDPETGLSQIGRAIDTIYANTGGEATVGHTQPDVPIPPAILLTPRIFVPDISAKEVEQARTEAIRLQYGVPGVGPLTLTPTGQLPNRISFGESFNDAMLDFMSASGHMPTDATVNMAITRDILRQKGTFVNGNWTNATFLPGTPEAHLYELVRAELLRCELAFIRTSTLQDGISQQDADAIFTLGQYVAYLNLPYIRAQLAGGK